MALYTLFNKRWQLGLFFQDGCRCYYHCVNRRRKHACFHSAIIIIIITNISLLNTRSDVSQLHLMHRIINWFVLLTILVGIMCVLTKSLLFSLLLAQIVLFGNDGNNVLPMLKLSSTLFCLVHVLISTFIFDAFIIIV